MAKVKEIKMAEQKKLDWRLLLNTIIGFSISRITVLYMLSSPAVAYLVLFGFNGTAYYMVLLGSILGLLSVYKQTQFFKYLFIFAIITLVNFLNKKEQNLYKKAILGAGTVLAVGLVKAVIEGFSIYFTVMAIMESVLVFAMVFVLDKAVHNLNFGMYKKYYTNEEMLSIALLIGAVISGLGNIGIGDFYIADAAICFIVIAMSYKGGVAAGTSAGLILGMFMVLTNSFNFNQVMIISCAGLAAGLLSDIGKMGTALGFIIGILAMSFYINKSMDEVRLYISSIISIPLFILIPQKIYNKFKISEKQEDTLENREYVKKVQNVTTIKLRNFSRAFNKLSDTLDNLSEKRNSLSQKEVADLFDEVANKVCKNCGMNTYCWESCFYDTYQTMLNILEVAEKKGYVTLSDIPENFSNKCINCEFLIETLNRLFDIYKNNLIWQNRMVDSRKLMAEQLKSVSATIENLSEEVKFELDFKEELERKIVDELAKKGIALEQVMVVESNKRYSVTIIHRPCYGEKICDDEIIPVVKSILKRDMVIDSFVCNISKKNENCTLKLKEEQKYKLITGAARLAKDESKVSGDCYSVLEIKDGQMLLALSDGMGTGKKANRESTASIELLEEFLESGFDKDISIKLINSVLVLKSVKESFSTLDMCVIDLYDASAEFVKIGAVSTFIKKDKIIDTIHSTSLPAGIFNDVDMEVSKRKLKENDLIVMVTDGVLDADETLINKEKWVEEILRNYKGRNPQELANYILNKAKEKSGDNIKDDMTVLVAKLWKKK